MSKPVTTSTLQALRALQYAPPVVTRRPRRGVFAGLAAAGLLAAAAIAFSFARESTLSALERRAAVEVDALVAGSARLSTALRTFGAAREPASAWFERATTLLSDLNERARVVDTTLVGIATMPRAHVAEALQSAIEALERARANADGNKDLMARDVLQSNGVPAVDALDAALTELRTATADEMGGRRGWWGTATWLILAAWAVVWSAGLFWIARRRDEATTTAGSREIRPQTESLPAAAAATLPQEPASALADAPGRLPATCDPGAVADACEVMAGVTDAAQIPSALEGVARALGASGLVLWLREGETLAPASAHGYPAGLWQQLGPVAVEDRNLIARAWQDRTSQTASADQGRRAAVAVPLGSLAGVTGVLSAEFPAGREADADVVATSRILAAQLSMMLGDGTTAAATPSLKATGS